MLSAFRELLRRPFLSSILFLTGMYGVWNLMFLGLGGGFAQQPFFQLWSGEMFPTMILSTAQGLMFAIVRIGLGMWSFFVPAITAAGFHTLAWILTGFVAFSALLGILFAPSNAGKTLEARARADRRRVRFVREPASSRQPVT